MTGAADTMSTEPMGACNDCGLDLPERVLQAHDTLYGGGNVSVESLANSIAERVLKADRKRAAGEEALSDRMAVEMSFSEAFGYYTLESLAAAARHWGRARQFEESECERLQEAKLCHEQNPDPNRGLVHDSPLTCQLDAHDADVPHCFSYKAAELVGATS